MLFSTDCNLVATFYAMRNSIVAMRCYTLDKFQYFLVAIISRMIYSIYMAMDVFILLLYHHEVCSCSNTNINEAVLVPCLVLYFILLLDFVVVAFHCLITGSITTSSTYGSAIFTSQLLSHSPFLQQGSVCGTILAKCVFYCHHNPVS